MVFDLARGHPARGVEVLHLAGEVRRERRVVEVRDRADAGLAGEQTLPRLLGAHAERGDEPDAGDDDPACHASMLSSVTTMPTIYFACALM